MKTKFTLIFHPTRCRFAFVRELAVLMRCGLFAGLVTLGPVWAHAQLFYDPNNTGGTALGGSGVWDTNTIAWWDGTNNVVWDGVTASNCAAIFSGTPGTVTLEGSISCLSTNFGGGPNAVPPVGITFNTNYTVNLNNYKIINSDGYGNGDYNVASGVTGRLVGQPSGTGGTLLFWGAGNLMLGDGSTLTNGDAFAGVGDFRGGRIIIDNDDVAGIGNGAISWYVNIGAGQVMGVGDICSGGLYGTGDNSVQMSGTGCICPGPVNETGTLSINGGLTEINNHASLWFNLGGLSQGAIVNGYSWLNVNGNATLDLQYLPSSSVGLRLVNGFIPTLGNTFDVLTASNIVFTAGAGGSSLSNVNYNVPILPGLAWSESIVTNGDLQSLRFTVVPGPMLTAPPVPLAYLNLNNNLTDQTGNGHNGVFVSTNAGYSANVPNATAGAASLAVPGDNSTAVSLTNTTGISEADAQSFTISVWFRISNSSDYPSLVTCSNPDTNAPINYYGWLGVNPAGKLTYGVFDIFNLSSVSFVADGNWHHGVVVHDGTAFSYQLYVDGVPDGFAYQTGTDQGANLWDVTIGKGFLAAGNVDEVAYWNQALTPEEVATVYYLGPVSGAPTLSVSRSAGNVSLSWLLGGYTLQQNASLTNPVGWTDLGTNSPVTLPIGTGSEFFRLKQ